MTVSITSVPLAVRDSTLTSPSGWTRSETVKVVFALAGWAEVGSKQEIVPVSPGTVLTIRPGLACWGRPAGRLRTATIYLNSGFLADHLRWLPGVHPLVPLLSHALDGNDRFGKLQLPESTVQQLTPTFMRLDRLSSGTTSDDFALFSTTADLLSTVGRAAGASGSVWAAESLLIPRGEVALADGLLRADLARSWRVEDLAREVALSASQLSRLFRTQMGLPPATYLSKLRAERMAELLLTTHVSVREAARAVGWLNTTVASRVFKKRYGLSPREFTSQHRERHGYQEWEDVG